MKKYYIATGLPRIKDHNLLRDQLNQRGFTITYDWTGHGSVKCTDKETLRKVAHAEIAGVLSADIVIVLLPGGQGTHTELGAALASGKQLFIHSENQNHFNPSEETCAFYHHNRIIQLDCPLLEVPDRLYEMQKTTK